MRVLEPDTLVQQLGKKLTLMMICLLLTQFLS